MPVSKPAAFTKSWTGLRKEGSQSPHWKRVRNVSRVWLLSTEIGVWPTTAALGSRVPGTRSGRAIGTAHVPALLRTHPVLSVPVLTPTHSCQSLLSSCIFMAHLLSPLCVLSRLRSPRTQHPIYERHLGQSLQVTGLSISFSVSVFTCIF